LPAPAISARRGAPQQFDKVFCRLDREWFDCIVLKTHSTS
jgi:hypothetical protein